MFYGSREEQNNAVRRIIDAYRHAASLFPIIRNVVTGFDNKVFNCRLEKALQEVDRKINVEKRFNSLNIYCYIANYSECVTLASVKLEDMPDGKRIPAALMIEDARERRAELLRKAADLEAAMENVDYYEGQIKYYADQIKKIVDSIPYEMRDIYNLNYRIQH